MDRSENQQNIVSPEISNNIEKTGVLIKVSSQVSEYINEGNPNVQDEVIVINDHEIKKDPSDISKDKQSARIVKQAIKDDQGLAAVAKDIQVTVKDGVVTLGGTVSTEQQINLATNTATALGAVDAVNNQGLCLKKVIDESKDPVLVET